MIWLIPFRLWAVIGAFLALLFIPGCKNETTPLQPINATRWIDIPSVQYSPNYFFVDTIYRSYWEQLHASINPTITGEVEQNQIIQMDVWQSVAIAPSNAGIYVKGRAYVALPSHGPDSVYHPGDVNTLDSSRSQGHFEEGYWVRLDPSDYKYDSFGGYVCLNIYSSSSAYAVSYTILGSPAGNWRVYGDSLPGGQEYYLKLIKPKNLADHPEYKPAWDLMLKNIYNVGRLGMYDSVSVRIGRTGYPGETFQLFGYSFLDILGLDRFNKAHAPGSDGRFDFIPGLTLDMDRGDLIFPTLRPFDNGIVEFFQHADPHRSVPDSLLAPALYDTTTTAFVGIPAQNNYVIHVGISIAGAGN
jgi:hypothetical protein